MSTPQQNPLAELAALPQWVVWKYVDRGGDKPTKRLYNPRTGVAASTDNPSTWGAYTDAEIASLFGCNGSEFEGIGFVFARNDGVFGIDLDKCVNDGRPAPWAQEIIDRFPGYWEKSPSGKGLHYIGKGKIPDEYRTGAGTGRRKGGLEVYDRGRFFTVTENALTARPVTDCQTQLSAFMAETFSKGTTATHDVTATFAEAMGEDIEALADTIRAHDTLKALWDNPAGEDQSAQDLRFAAELLRAIQTTTDSEAMALLSEFRRQSGQKPEKAEREDYLRRTVATARAKVGMASEQFGDVSAELSKPERADERARPENRRIKLITVEELLSRPPPEFIIDKILPERGVGILAGAPGSFKSFIALAMGLSIATGGDLGGGKVKQGPVWYVANEGQSALAWRVEAWRRFHGVDDIGEFLIAETTPDLGRDQSINQAIDELSEAGSPRMIVIDTFIKAAGGVEINSAKEVGEAIKRAYRIADAFKCFVLIIDHLGKDAQRGVVGSYAKKGNTDFVGLLTRAGNAATLLIDKQKDGEDQLRFHFKKHDQVVPRPGDDTFTSYPVLEMVDGAGALTQPEFIISHLQFFGTQTRAEIKEAFAEAFPGKGNSFDPVFKRLADSGRINEGADGYYVNGV